MSALDKLLVDAEQLRASDLQVAINARVAQDVHLTALMRRQALEEQRRGRLQRELRDAQAAEGAPAPDPAAPGGRLHGLRQAVAGMGLPVPPAGRR
jgi:hypothetical protein